MPSTAVPDEPSLQHLRRPTLVSAPLFLVGCIGAAALVAVASWAVWHPDSLGRTFVTVLLAATVVTVSGFVAAAGCYVAIDGPELRDVVAWRTRRRIDRSRIRTARVRRGAWRWFELELDDGELVTLAGACPSQIAARMGPDARFRDMGDLDLLMGDDHTT